MSCTVSVPFFRTVLSGEIPKILTVRVCGAMPVKKDGSYEKFESFNLPCGNDILEYHWLYFEEENRKIKNIESSINKNIA